MSNGYKSVNVNGLTGRAKELGQAMVKSGSHIAEHRLVMSLHLDRPLVPHEEIVHHKDGNKSNNKIENLKLLTKRKHHSGHGDSYYQGWQEALSHIKKLEDEIVALGGSVEIFGLFSKAQIKCAFFNWFDWMIPNGQQHLAIDMGETENEVRATIERFWRVFMEMLLDVEEAE